jgi:hypothetical protein
MLTEERPEFDLNDKVLFHFQSGFDDKRTFIVEDITLTDEGYYCYDVVSEDGLGHYFYVPEWKLETFESKVK